jgi:hypothetical protein
MTTPGGLPASRAGLPASRAGLPGSGGLPDSGGLPASRADVTASGGLTGSGGLPDPGELRQLVREILREILPAATHQPNPMKARSIGSQPAESRIHRVADSPAPGTSPGEAAVQPVRVGSDQELHEFVLRILRLAEDPQRRQDLLAGRLRFTLAPAASASGNGTLAPAGPPAATAVIRRVEKGAVTERAVIAAAKAGHRLVLGPGAVLTPLARDKARALGVPVEKER